MIAHNALISRDEYERIVRLVDEVAAPLQKALDNLDRVYIPEEDKEQVAENVVSNISVYYGDFILLWKSFESLLTKIAESIDLDADAPYTSPLRVFDTLHDGGLIDDEIYEDGKELIQFRNFIVHDTSVSISEQDITNYTRRLDRLVDILRALLKPVSFHDECVYRIEKHLGHSFARHTRTAYLSEDSTIALTCVVSKAHERNNQTYYWFGFHRYHIQFLESAKKSYAAFGCGAEHTVVLIPFSVFVEYLRFMSVTDRSGRYYWHVHILDDGNKLLLQRSGADPIDLSTYLVPNQANN